MISRDFEWQEFLLAGGVPVLAKRCKSRADFVESLVVAVHRDEEIVGIYLHQGENVASTLRHSATKILQDNDLRLPELYKYLYRGDVERIFGEINALPFYEVYPSKSHVYDIVEKLSQVRLHGWIYTTMSCRGIALLKDIDTFENDSRHAVGVTDTGIAVYRSNIQSGCQLGSDEQIFFMGTNNIDVDALARLCCWSDAVEICEVHRSIRRWIFHAALEKA